MIYSTSPGADFVGLQLVVTKAIPKKKKCKKSKCLSEESLQIAEERRQAKDKGERGGCIK